MGFPGKTQSQPGEPLRGRWPRWWILGAGMVLAIAAGIFLLRPHRRPPDGDPGPMRDLGTDFAASPSPLGKPSAIENPLAARKRFTTEKPLAARKRFTTEKPLAARKPLATEKPLATDALPAADTKPHEPFFADLTLPPKTVAELVEEAKHVMARMIADFPDLTDSLELRARFMNWRGETAEAVKDWERCLQIDPRYAHAYLGLGRIAAAQGRFAESAGLYRKALEISTGFPQAQMELARVLIDLGQAGEAISTLEKPGTAQSPEWHFLLGQAYDQQQNYEESCRHYQTAAQLQPDYADAHFGWATALTRLGRQDEASAAMARFRELHDQDLQVARTDKEEFDDPVAAGEVLAVMYANLGTLYVTRGQVVAGEELWRRAARIGPRNVECRQGLAWLARRAGKAPEAIQMLRELAEIAPMSQIYWVEIGRLQSRAEDFEAAELAFRKACEADPQAADGYVLLAQLYLQANRKLDEAAELVELAAQRSDAADVDELRAAIRKKQGEVPAAPPGER